MMVRNQPGHRPSRSFVFASAALPFALSIYPTSSRAVSREPAVALPGLSPGSYALLDVNGDDMLDRMEFANLVAVLASVPPAGGKWRLAPIDGAPSAASAPVQPGQAAALLNRSSTAFRRADADANGAVSRLELIRAFDSTSDRAAVQHSSASIMRSSATSTLAGDVRKRRPADASSRVAQP